MEIIWHGHACFSMKDQAATLVTDPYPPSLGLGTLNLSANVVTVSHSVANHNAVAQIQAGYKLLNRPGEFEVNNIFASSYTVLPEEPVSAYTPDKRNLIFLFEIEHITVCHLGDLCFVPKQQQIEVLSNVDVLLLPVGGGRGLTANQAAEVVGIIEPAIVIPMHYQLPGLSVQLNGIDKFLKEMGITQADPQSRLRLSAGNLPQETEIIVLDPKFPEN